MKKDVFLRDLKKQLERRVTTKEAEEAMRYYDELISDRMESSESESKIIASLGSVEEIARVITVESIEKRESPKNIKGIVSVSNSLLWVAKTPIMIVMFFVFALVMFILGVTFFSLIVSFGAALFGVVFSYVDSLVLLGASGFEWMEFLFISAFHMVVFGAMLGVFGVLYKVGILLLNTTIKIFTKLLKRRMVKQNVGETI